jgi:hypothetical protein
MKQDPSFEEEAGNGKDAKEAKEEGPRSFTRFLAGISDGEAESQLSYELFELGKRLQAESKMQLRKVPGTLKLTVKMVADPNKSVEITYAIDVKAPKALTTPALFWFTPAGNLSRTDTRQLELKPREVPAPKREVREAPPSHEPREV